MARLATFNPGDVDQWGGETAGAQQLLTQRYQETGIKGKIEAAKQKVTGEKFAYTPIAEELQRAMGWDESNPMPTNHDALAKQFGNNENFRQQMKSILDTEKKAKRSIRFQEQMTKMKENAPGLLGAILTGALLFEQIVQQGTTDAGSENRQR